MLPVSFGFKVITLSGFHCSIRTDNKVGYYIHDKPFNRKSK